MNERFCENPEHFGYNSQCTVYRITHAHHIQELHVRSVENDLNYAEWNYHGAILHAQRICRKPNAEYARYRFTALLTGNWAGKNDSMGRPIF